MEVAGPACHARGMAKSTSTTRGGKHFRVATNRIFKKIGGGCSLTTIAGKQAYEHCKMDHSWRRDGKKLDLR